MQNSYNWDNRNGVIDNKTGEQILQLVKNYCSEKFRRMAGKNLVSVLNNIKQGSAMNMTCEVCRRESSPLTTRMVCDECTALPPPVRSEPLLAAIDRLQAQFAGYALRVASSDSGNDIILGTIIEIRRIAANAAADTRRGDKTEHDK